MGSKRTPELPGVSAELANVCVAFFNQQQTTTQLADIQTPPLGNTPMPIVQTARANVNPNTNLTRTQEALLSPEEKIIASRTT